ncbi:MAG: hypothetical protein GYA51_06075 [Candidatus Methanofastidiosa archaeon]|nr:hypothetical protein [Candidatus Methanofastidiosa archaeon]
MKNLYWNYFIAIERDFENLSRYVEFSEKNYDTFSIELARLLIASSSETEVVLKDLCKIIDNSFLNIKKPNIMDIKNLITKHCKNLIVEPFYIDRYDIKRQPFINWKSNITLKWWDSYNNVKHNRNSNFNEANLRNVIDAMGALLISNFYYQLYSKHFYSEDGITIDRVLGELEPRSLFLRLENDYYPSSLLIDKAPKLYGEEGSI